ncbi:hypothetical protein D3C77_624390 [compost metagenome]
MVVTSADRVAVDSSMVSVTSVMAAASSTTRFSKSPPSVLSMVTSTLSRSI